MNNSMTADLPAPLVPPEVDLRGMDWMPLMGDRLFGSETWINASTEGKVAALQLWWHSYAHERPSGSLPDSDKLLSAFAGYGVAVRSWRRIRPEALRGWVKCSDGRLYHKVVAELALKGWKLRKHNRDRQQKWREKNSQRDSDVAVTETVTVDVTKSSRYGGQDRTGQDKSISPSNSSGVSPSPACARKAAAPLGGAIVKHPDEQIKLGNGDARFGQVYATVERLLADLIAVPLNGSRIHAWLAAGADPDLDVYPTIQRLAARCRLMGDRVQSLGYFDRAVADAVASRTRPLPAGRAPATTRAQEQADAVNVAVAEYRRRLREHAGSGDLGVDGALPSAGNGTDPGGGGGLVAGLDRGPDGRDRRAGDAAGGLDAAQTQLSADDLADAGGADRARPHRARRAKGDLAAAVDIILVGAEQSSPDADTGASGAGVSTGDH